MSSYVFDAFIRNAEQFGLPIRFLREVSNSSYTIVSGGSSSYVNTWLNVLVLDDGDVASAQHAATLDPRAEVGVLNFYHEATHAWLDLNENRPDVTSLRKSGTAHYDRASLDSGGVADDPERVFQEAMGEYVGHRAATYWSTWAVLSKMSSALERARQPSEHQVAVALAAVRDARQVYDRRMGQVVFGYQPRAWYRRGEQQLTSRPTTASMREFADRVLLESKIPTSFLKTRQPAELWERMRRKYYPRLEG